MSTNTRECGGCTACCNTHIIPTLDKPHHHPCSLCTENVGCSVHGTDEQPEECRDYSCAYRDGHGEKHERPDKTGIVQEEIFHRLLGSVWTICEVWRGALVSEFAQREVRRALDKRLIVGTETTEGICMFIIPKGKKISLSARALLFDELIFDEVTPMVARDAS